MLISFQANAAVKEDMSESDLEIFKLRDPFKIPIISLTPTREKEPLELFELEKIKLIGVTTGPKEMQAVVMTPDGETHYVYESSRIGTRNGRIKKITSDAVLVGESIVNVMGQEEVVNSVIRLPDEDQGGGKKTEKRRSRLRR